MLRVILRATYRQIKIVILLLQSRGSAQSLGLRAKGLGFRAYGVGLGFGVEGVGIRV